MENRFNLRFKNTYSSITGNKYGQSVYRDQVAPQIDFKKDIVIIFPDFIEDIGVSFIQGFFEEIKMKIGMYGIEKNVEVQSGSIKDLKQLVLKYLQV